MSKSTESSLCPFHNFDHHNPNLDAETLWNQYAKMQQQGPVVRSEMHGGFWMLTHYEDVDRVARDPETFSSASGHLIPEKGNLRVIPIDYDPPMHGQYRALMSRLLSRVRDIEPEVRGYLSTLVDSLTARRKCELVSELALPLPLWVLARFVGLSESALQVLRGVTEDMWNRVNNEALESARASLYELMGQELDRHTASGDYIAWLTEEARVDDRLVTHEEAVSVLVSFAIAGHETTLNAVGNLLYDLATVPGLQRRIHEEPEIIPFVVEESLRLRAPAQLYARTVTKDSEIHGTKLKAGDKVFLAYAAANRDPKVYENPDRFDPDRFRPERKTSPHLSFGRGIHLCVGASLARMEMRNLLEELRERPMFSLTEEAIFSHLEGGHHMGPRSLPAIFEQA